MIDEPLDEVEDLPILLVELWRMTPNMSGPPIARMDGPAHGQKMVGLVEDSILDTGQWPLPSYTNF